MQPLSAPDDPRLVHLLHVAGHGGEQLLRGHHAGFGVLVGHPEDHEAHGSQLPLLIRSRAAKASPCPLMTNARARGRQIAGQKFSGPRPGAQLLAHRRPGG